MTRQYSIILLGILGLLIAFTAWSCQEDSFNDSSDVMLEFSTDTLQFDTVFTELGSATRILKAHNRGNRPIQISEIRLEEGTASKFRINVDGETIPSNGSAVDIPVAGNDSVYIFIEVTIDPDDPLSVSPFVLYENLLFTTNGNTQRTVLEAFGQNANYIPSRFSGGTANIYTCDMGIETWNDPKPYVIYGVLVVDSCELILPAGADIYVHGGLVNAGGGVFYNDGIWFFDSEAKLRIEGTVDEPVEIQGDRLEENFQQVSGQWGGIRLGTGNNTHVIRNAIIRNSIVGVRVDSAATLDIRDTQIRHTSNAGILGVHANITASNCLVVDNGSNSVQLEFGGDYEFDYCTMANFGADASALRLSNALCLDALCGDCLGNDLSAHFTNCIIMGSRSDEISLFDRQCTEGDGFDISFRNCVVKVNELLENYPQFFTDICLANSCYQYPSDEPLFLDEFEGDYHLDSLSFATEKAMPLFGITTDLDGILRDDAMPDAGCYESTFE